MADKNRGKPDMSTGWRIQYMAQPGDEAHFVRGDRSFCGLEGLWGALLARDDGTDDIEPCPACLTARNDSTRRRMMTDIPDLFYAFDPDDITEVRWGPSAAPGGPWISVRFDAGNQFSESGTRSHARWIATQTGLGEFEVTPDGGIRWHR